MSGLIPEGYISLEEAWQRYFMECPGEASLESFVSVFEKDFLRAFVRLPGSSENLRLTAISWQGFYRDRVFLCEVIMVSPDDAWSAFQGQTPLVRELEFSEWLSVRVGLFEAELAQQFDPMLDYWWTLTMAFVWLSSRNKSRVLESKEEFQRQRYGKVLRAKAVLNVAWDMHLARSSVQPPPRNFRLPGINDQTGFRELIEPLTTVDVNLEFDSELAPRLSHKPSKVRFTDVRVLREEVLAAWPLIPNHTTVADPISCPQPKKRVASSASVTREYPEWAQVRKRQRDLGTK